MKKYLPSLVTGFAAGVLQIVPLVKSFACCLIVPAAAGLAVFLDQKSKGNNSEEIPVSRGVVLGIFAGLFAAFFATFFEVFITMITHNNEILTVYPELQKFISSFPLDDASKQQALDIFQTVVQDIKTTGFSFFYTLSIAISNLFVNIIFGLIGGVVGANVFNSRIRRQ